MKKLQNQEKKSESNPNRLDVCNKLSLKTVFSDRKINEPRESTSKYESSASLTLNKSNNKEDQKKSRPRPLLKRPKNARLEERYKELFGDFEDDISVVKNKVPKISSTHTISSDKTVNNVLSTTVNVNIYNSSKTEGQNKIVNRITHSENSNESTNETCNNRLRIDVSLSENGSNFVEARSLSKKKRKPQSNSYKSRKKQRVHNHAKYRQQAEKTKIDQIKSDMLVLSALHDNSEDDPVQELWKIFGMESPTDRSENIIKSYPQTTNLKDITNNDNSMLNSILHREQANEVLIKPTAVSTLNSISSEEHIISKKGCENIENTSADQGTFSESFDTKKCSKNNGIKSADGRNDSNESFDKEPICRIAETFSLSELSPGSLFYDGVKSTTKECNETVGKSTKLSICRKAQKNKGSESELCLIETISLCDDENDEDLIILPSEKSNNNDVAKKVNENKSKVGTIRVKNLGQLLDPQNVPETSRTTEINNIPLQCCNEPTGNQENKGNSVEEQFFRTYKHYFDELLESKVLKLGELLHLAVSDEIRRKERIKRAEQLSSSDLIQEEIQRANKDFTELMNVRGNEFAPLFGNILTKFDEGSKVTLFFTLFIRIFERAKEIDIENGNHILSAKTVVHTMLLKILSAHEDISNAMNFNPTDFAKQVNVVNKLLKAVHLKYYSQSNDGSIGNLVSPNAFPTNVSTGTKNRPQETTTSNGAFNTNSGCSGMANITTHPSVVRTTAQSLKPANAGDHVTFRRNSTHMIGNNETKIVDPTNVPTVTVQPQKTANKSVLPQTIISASTDSSIVGSSSSTSTSTASNINVKRNNSMFQNTQIARDNTHYSPFQKPDSEIKRTNPETTHSVVNRLGANYVNIQQNEHIRQMASPYNTISFKLNPNAPLAPGHTDKRPGRPRKVANSDRRTSSTSQSNMVSKGISSPAVHDVSTTRQNSVQTHPSSSSVEILHTNYPLLNNVQRQSTSIFKQYNSPNTTTKSPNLNFNVKTPPVKGRSWETQLGAINTTGAINPNQEGSTKIRVLDHSARRLNENVPSETNLRTLPTSNSNQYKSTTTSTPMSNGVVMITTATKMTYQQENPPIYIYSDTTGQLKEVSVTNSINANNRSLPSSIVETPSSSNSQTRSQLINPTSKAQQHNFTIESATSSILMNMLKNDPEINTSNGRQHSVNMVDKSSTKTDLRERNVFASTSSTVHTPFSVDSRTEKVTLNTLLNGMSDESGRQYVSSSASLPISNNTIISNTQDRGSTYGSEQQLRVINLYSSTEPKNPPPGKTTSSRDYTNSFAGLGVAAYSAPQVGRAIANQAVQSSKSKTTYEPPMSSHRMHVTKEPTLHLDPVVQPSLSVSGLSTTSTYVNQQEHMRSTSTSAMPGYPVLTSSLPSSDPREPSLSPVRPISSDLTQPTAAPSQQVSVLYLRQSRVLM